MEYARLGNTGMKVSRICLGCMSYGKPGKGNEMALDEEQSRPYIQCVLEIGINFFDTADVYSGGMSETVTGGGLRDFAASRDEVVIATKVHSQRVGSCESQVKAHVRGNLNVGNSKGLMIEAITQCLPYMGFPRTLNAINCVNEMC